MGNVGKKYVLTIEEEMGDAPSKLYRVAGFRSLVLDECGLSKLEPYSVSAYHMGYKDGCKDAWEAARKIILDKMDGGIVKADVIRYLGDIPYNVLLHSEVQDVIEGIHKYENRSTDEIIEFVNKYGVDKVLSALETIEDER